MTRERIAEGLQLVVLFLACGISVVSEPPDGWDVREWAYVKGIASAAILQLRNQLVTPS